MADYHSILGLKQGASKDEIRKAYRRLAMEYHPDKNSSPEAQEKFIDITEAYDNLMEGKSSRIRYINMRRKKSASEIRKEEQRERIKQYVLRRYEQFRSEREEHRKSLILKVWFYGEAWFDLVMAFVILLIPVAASLYNGSWWYMVLLPLSVGMGASFYFKGERLLKRAKMIYGKNDVFSMKELEDIYFYKGPRVDPYAPPRMRHW